MGSLNMAPEPLFACSRCFTKHPFEELSQGQQLCKECRGAFPVVKCTYCRSEFQQESKNSTSAICKKCEHNVKQYGLPSSCQYCNTIAAFIGNKCQRCAHSERKYGPPQVCNQCKQRCAFERNEDKKWMDGKLLCYLCTSSLKRALEKSKQTDQLRHGHSASRHSSSGGSKREATKRPHHRVDVTKHPPLSDEPVVKQPALTSKLKLSSASEDPTSDHMIQIAALKEEIAKLNKQIGQMNQGMLEKDKQITQLKAQIHNIEQDYRRKAKDTGASHGKMVEEMSRKIKELQRQNAVLSKGARKADRSLNKAVLDKTPVDVPATGSGPVSADASSASNSPVI